MTSPFPHSTLEGMPGSNVSSLYGLMAAPEVKRWLHRCICRLASEHELYPGQEFQVEPMERLADYVQHLRDDDERFVRLAKAGLDTDQDRATTCLQSRCASFGPGLYFGHDPDALLTEYSWAEVADLTGHQHRAQRADSESFQGPDS
jgi:hypothetical protein